MLRIIKELVRNDQRIFVGVIDSTNPRLETPEEVSDRILKAAEYIPLANWGRLMTVISLLSAMTLQRAGKRLFFDEVTRAFAL